jgi:hypothetical protein
VCSILKLQDWKGRVHVFRSPHLSPENAPEEFVARTDPCRMCTTPKRVIALQAFTRSQDKALFKQTLRKRFVLRKVADNSQGQLSACILQTQRRPDLHATTRRSVHGLLSLPLSIFTSTLDSNTLRDITPCGIYQTKRGHIPKAGSLRLRSRVPISSRPTNSSNSTKTLAEICSWKIPPLIQVQPKRRLCTKYKGVNPEQCTCIL